MRKMAVVYWSGTGSTEAMAAAQLAADPVTCQESPDEDALAACRALGAALAG